MKILFLLFVYISTIFASSNIWVKTYTENNISKNIYVLLDKNLSVKYNVKWVGSSKSIDNLLVANGRGKLTWIRKSDNYQSIPKTVEFKDGRCTENMKIYIQYKCIDSQCEDKETKGNFTYILEDTNTKFKEPFRYRGTLQLHNDKIIYTGIGTIETNSSVYSGELNNSQITGYGEFKTYLNNNLDIQIEQKGLWNKGKFISGYMSNIYKDGGLYKGYSINGLPDGKGIFIWTDKSKYNGFFKDGKKNGFGIYTFSDGSTYAGNYKDDIKDGYGELYIKSRDIYYKGEFKNGKFNGLGELYVQDKATYIGKFKDNKPHGRGIIIDENDNIIEVLAYRGAITPLQTNITSSFNIFNLFVTDANAWSINDTFSKVIDIISGAVNESVKWVEENKEHLINAAKGCLAGGISGAGIAAVSGAIAGSFVPGIGTLAGAGVGGVAGGLNGCINQGMEAFKISKNNGGHYGWKEAKQAFVEEISLENLVIGAGGVALESLVTSAKVAQVISKIPGLKKNMLTKESVAILTLLTSKSPAIKRAIVFLGKKGKQVGKRICKFKFLKNITMCKKKPPPIPLQLSVVSWNLKNLSIHSANRDWNSIKSFIKSKSSVDVIMLQEIMNKAALNKISNNNFKVILSNPKGKFGKKEYYGFLVNKKFTIMQLKDFNQYKKFRVPPSVLILNNKIALVNVHIIFGNNDKLSYEKRLKEVHSLIKIIKELKKKYQYVLVAGDFNMEIGMDYKDLISLDGRYEQDQLTNVADAKKDLDVKTINRSLQAMLVSLNMFPYINEATSIGKKLETRFSNSYDHFVTSGFSHNAIAEKGIIKHRSTNVFHSRVSDHLPISGTFDFFKTKKKRK